MFTKWLTACGFTRDWAGWLWLRVVSAAMLVDSLTTDQISAVFNYIGVPITPVWEHRIMTGVVAVLWIAGKQAHSGLPSEAEKNSVTITPQHKEGV